MTLSGVCHTEAGLAVLLRPVTPGRLLAGAGFPPPPVGGAARQPFAKSSQSLYPSAKWQTCPLTSMPPSTIRPGPRRHEHPGLREVPRPEAVDTLRASFPGIPPRVSRYDIASTAGGNSDYTVDVRYYVRDESFIVRSKWRECRRRRGASYTPSASGPKAKAGRDSSHGSLAPSSAAWRAPAGAARQPLAPPVRV